MNVREARVREALLGVVAVLITPYSRGAVDRRRTDELATRVDRAGIHALTSLGNTAEVFQLTASEQRDHREAVAAQARSAVLIAGVAGPSKTVAEDARHASELGYDAVMLHEPADPFGDEAGLIDYYRSVADVSDLPVVVYLRTGRLHGNGLRELASIPRIVGVKFARADLATLNDALRDGAGEECTWVNGAAESRALAFADIGINGFTSGIANVRPDVALALNAALRSGGRADAERLVEPLLAVEEIRTREHNKYNVAVLKALLAHQGFDCGGVRPPHVELPSDLRDSLLDGFGVWPETAHGTSATPLIESELIHD